MALFGKVSSNGFPRIKIISASLVLTAAVFVCGLTLTHTLWYSPDGSRVLISAPAAADGSSSTPAAAGAATSSVIGIPARLSIPALRINARVQDVGLTSGGSVGTPDNFTDVAWYANGPRPGQGGVAVIDGHVDNGLSLAGVFKHLKDIQVGDSVDVETQSRQTLRFVVVATTSYPYASVPPEALSDANAQPSLNLITCTGTWVPAARTYDRRLIVFTRLES